MSDKPDIQKVKMLLYLLGTKGREMYKTMKFTKVVEGDTVEIEENDRKIDMIIKEFDKHCDPRKNETVERYKFFCTQKVVNHSINTWLN